MRRILKSWIVKTVALHVELTWQKPVWNTCKMVRKVLNMLKGQNSVYDHHIT